MKIKRFFEIRFIDTQYSREELLDFTQDHIARLAAQNGGGEFNELLAATDTAYANFGGTVGSELTARAIARARS